MVTRDSLVLWIAAGGALVLYLQSASAPPTSWSYSEWLQFAAFVLAWAAGKLQTSPLAGENDATKVSGPRSWLLPLLLVGALSAGCASAGGVVTPNPTPDQTQAVRNDAAKLAIATKEAASIAVEARRLAEQAFTAGVISRDAMLRINQAALDLGIRGEAFVAFAESVTTYPSLRATAEALHGIFRQFIAHLQEVGGLTATKAAAIQAALAAFVAFLGGAL